MNTENNNENKDEKKIENDVNGTNSKQDDKQGDKQEPIIIKRDESNKGYFRLFCERIWNSIVNFDKYEEITTISTKTSIAYVAALILIFAIVNTIAATFKYTNMVNNVISQISSSEADFSISKDDGLVISNDNKQYILEKNNVKIILDETSSDYSTYSNEMNEYNGCFILLLKDTFYLKINKNNNIVSYNYNDFFNLANIENINKNEILEKYNNHKNNITYIFVIYIFITIFVSYFMSALVDILALVLIGKIVTKIYGMKISFSGLFSIAASALTLSILLECIYLTINILTGFTIKYFQIMYLMIAIIYMISAIVLLRTRFRRIMQELLKLQEIQNRKKDNEEEKNDNENNDKDDKEKNKDDKKDNNKEDNENGEDKQSNNGTIDGLENND